MIAAYKYSLSRNSHTLIGVRKIKTKKGRTKHENTAKEKKKQSVIWSGYFSQRNKIGEAKTARRSNGLKFFSSRTADCCIVLKY